MYVWSNLHPSIHYTSAKSKFKDTLKVTKIEVSLKIREYACTINQFLDTQHSFKT